MLASPQRSTHHRARDSPIKKSGMPEARGGLGAGKQQRQKQCSSRFPRSKLTFEPFKQLLLSSAALTDYCIIHVGHTAALLNRLFFQLLLEIILVYLK